MANPSVVINGTTYSSVPSVTIPKQGGGSAEFFYTGDANATSGDLLTGKTAFSSSGSISGGMANNGATGGTISTKAGTVTIPAGYTTGGSVGLSNVSDCVAANILSGKSILGVSGSLTVPTISQNGAGVLSIS